MYEKEKKINNKKREEKLNGMFEEIFHDFFKIQFQEII